MSVPGAEGDLRTMEPTEASCDISEEVTLTTPAMISQDIFSPEDSGMPSAGTSQEETPCPSQEENLVSPSFDMFAPSQESANASALTDKGDAASLKPKEKAEDTKSDAAMETSDGGRDAEPDGGEIAEVDEVGVCVAEKRTAEKTGSKLKSSSQSGTKSFMSAESGSEEDEEVAERGKGRERKQSIECEADYSSNDDEEESVASDLNKSVTSALKTPDVPRLIVPGLLGAVLQKFGQKTEQATRKPVKVTSSLQTPEGCAGTSFAKRKEGVGEKPGKKVKVSKKSATPKKFPKLARVGSTSAGKVVKRRAQNTVKSPKLKKSLASRSKVKISGNHQQVSTASALLALQKMRTAGTWVKCTIQECGKWRKLQEMDPSHCSCNHPS